MPVWVVKSVAGLTRLFSRQRCELLAFFARGMSRDAVGPATGTHQLSDFFAELAVDGGGTHD